MKPSSHQATSKIADHSAPINCEYYPDRKTIICANPKLGFNVEEHMNTIEKFY